ncbi:MAG: hypothetical protein F6J95_003765 [Leptolyngbya sp. SIO1E4]|nr:hypothetical protein [Leptolyngbya sp. SIO1E4]
MPAAQSLVLQLPFVALMPQVYGKSPHCHGQDIAEAASIFTMVIYT